MYCPVGQCTQCTEGQCTRTVYLSLKVGTLQTLFRVTARSPTKQKQKHAKLKTALKTESCAEHSSAEKKINSRNKKPFTKLYAERINLTQDKTFHNQSYYETRGFYKTLQLRFPTHAPQERATKTGSQERTIRSRVLVSDHKPINIDRAVL